jgi:hypothetical protein
MGPVSEAGQYAERDKDLGEQTRGRSTKLPTVLRLFVPGGTWIEAMDEL